MTFIVQSRSRRGVRYEMQHTPEGYAVHVDEGCEGEIFNGPLGCWHSKNYTALQEDAEDMTQAFTPYQGGAVVERTFNEEDLATLKQTICKGASDSELKLFIATCQHTGLDPFMKQIHCVMRNQKDGDRWVKAMTIQIGIDGYRLIAERTGQMQGMDGPQWTYDGSTWLDVPSDTETPLAARVVIYRKGVERGFPAVARWGAYVQTTSSGSPNSVWAQRGPEQLAKCAEALALRRAFPAEITSLPQNVEYASDVDPDWSPEQVRDRYVEEHPNVIEATGTVIEPEGELDDELPATPEPDEDAAPEFMRTPEAPTNVAETKQAIITALEDSKKTWDNASYLALFKDLSQFMPEGARFAIDGLPDDKAVECLTFVRERRGEPVGAAP